MIRIIALVIAASVGLAWTFTTPNISIPARYETEPVPSEGDAADDTATWIHPTDPLRSLIVGTDKKFGLIFYDLSGRKFAQYPVGKINNIDIRSGFGFGESRAQVIVGTDRTTNSVMFWAIDPASLRLLPAGRIPLNIEPYGLCIGRLSGLPGLSVFVTTKAGLVQHWLAEEGATSLRPRLIQNLPFASQTEGCVVDDERGRFFVGEEDVGIWMIDFQKRTAPVLIDRVAPHGRLAADVEGLSIYNRGDTNGFLVVSSQGDNSFHVYDLVDGAHRGRFTVGPGVVDGVTDTDGIEVVSAAIHPGMPHGFLIVQDGTNEDAGGQIRHQNFKIIDWSHIRSALRLNLERYPLGAGR